MYGSLVQHGNEQPKIEFVKRTHPDDGRVVETDWCYVVPETVGQFTGLKDKNGKEIYEGDTIKYTRYNFKSEYLKEEKIEEIYVVFWNEPKHAFYCHTNFESGGGASGYLSFEDKRAEKNEIEVIGNIHDNPEFMKEGE